MPLPKKEKGGGRRETMIYLTGDTHGVYGMTRFSPGNFPAGERLSRDDLVVVLGDFGLFWSDPPTEPEREELERLSSRPWTTLFLDGNHENFTLLDALPQEERFGAPVGVAAPGVFHLKRGYVYTLEGKTCFVFGGARSLDRHGRTAGKSWWRREIPSEEEYRRGLDSLESAGWAVDWILTHTAPEGILKATNLAKYLAGDPVSLYLEEIRKETDYKRWFCGHLHRNAYFPGERVHVLRENILEGGTGNVVSVERNRPPLKERLRTFRSRLPQQGD